MKQFTGVVGSESRVQLIEEEVQSEEVDMSSLHFYFENCFMIREREIQSYLKQISWPNRSSQENSGDRIWEGMQIHALITECRYMH